MQNKLKELCKKGEKTKLRQMKDWKKKIYTYPTYKQLIYMSLYEKKFRDKI